MSMTRGFRSKACNCAPAQFYDCMFITQLPLLFKPGHVPDLSLSLLKINFYFIFPTHFPSPDILSSFFSIKFSFNNPFPLISIILFVTSVAQSPEGVFVLDPVYFS